MRFLPLLLIVAVVFLAGCTQFTQSNVGRAVLAITDAAPNMGAVNSVQITVDSVSVHSATEGWVTVSSTPKTYDLIKLSKSTTQQILADVQLKTGTYEQVRLNVSKVTVVDTNGTHDAKLPSGDLKIVGDLVVGANSTSTATFDFMANKSLHVTGNGQYILAPVVQLTTQDNATVTSQGNDEVTIKGGHVRTNVQVGMDVDGNVGQGLGIDDSKNITVGSDGKIHANANVGLTVGS